MTEFNPRDKLLRHPLALAAFAENDVTAPPIGIEISPTNWCTARCDWCFYVSGTYKQKHSREELALPALRRLLDELAFMGVKAVTWTGGGDPAVYSGIDDAISHTRANGLRQGIFTNGYIPLANPGMLDWIRITVTEKYVITKHVAEYAKATKVGVNFNLCRENEGHLRPMIQAAKETGVRYFQVRPALADRADLQEMVELPEWIREYETNDFRIETTPYKWTDYLRPHGYPICHGHRLVPFVWHNGDVAACAYHFGKPDFTFGNLLTDGGFKAIWLGERRRSMVNIPVVRECQHNCKPHESNKVLATMRGEMPPIPDEDFV